MPAKPLCQVIECCRPGSKETSLSGWSRLLTTLGIWISSQRLAQLVADDAGCHPVGQGDDVAVDALAGAQLRPDLGVVGVVVVDVLAVADLDPGLLHEGLERRGPRLLAVHVEVGRPVGPLEDLLAVRDVRRQVQAGRAARRRLGRGAPGEREPGAGGEAGAEQRAAAQPAGGCRARRGRRGRGGAVTGAGWVSCVQVLRSAPSCSGVCRPALVASSRCWPSRA